MKKNLLCTACFCILISPILHAESFSGPTLGIQGGVSSGQIKQDTTDGSGSITSNEVSSTSGIAVATAGIGEIYNNFYYGGEVRATFTGGNTKTAVGPSSGAMVATKPGTSVIVAGRGGMLFTERAMGFVSLGVGLAEVSYTVQDSGGTLTTKKNDMIFVPGVGTEIALTESLNARFDISYTIGKKRTMAKADLVSAGIASYTNATFKPKWINCSIGVNYRF